jgi:hypothetical protein
MGQVVRHISLYSPEIAHRILLNSNFHFKILKFTTKLIYTQVVHSHLQIKYEI